jgi:hypothetical protein
VGVGVGGDLEGWDGGAEWSGGVVGGAAGGGAKRGGRSAAGWGVCGGEDAGGERLGGVFAAAPIGRGTVSVMRWCVGIWCGEAEGVERVGTGLRLGAVEDGVHRRRDLFLAHGAAGGQ